MDGKIEEGETWITYRFENYVRIVFLVGLDESGYPFPEARLASVEIGQAGEYRSSVSARADVHQTSRTASPVAEAIAYVYHVRILFRRIGGLGRVFGIEKVLGGGGLLEILGLFVGIASFRVVPQRLLAQHVTISLQSHVITRLRVLVRQRSGMERTEEKGNRSEFESNDRKLIKTSSFTSGRKKRVIACKRDYRTIQFTCLSKVNEEDARQQSFSSAFNFVRFDRRD